MPYLNVLWAPWRMSYIVSGEQKECIFCKAVLGNDKDSYVVLRSHHSIAMLNIYPYNTGHVMVAPKRHIPRPELLAQEEVLDMHNVLSAVIKALDEEYNPQGYNIGLNVGRVAGAGVEHHLHIHVVPRWSGDANFMSVIGGVKVIPEDLTRTYERLKSRLIKMRAV